jgi:purine nucleosidase
MAFAKMGARGGFGSAGVLGNASLPTIAWSGSASPTTYPTAVLAEPNLLGFWPLDDASAATSFADAKGNRPAVIQNKGTGALLQQSAQMSGNSALSTRFVSASSGAGLVSVSDSAAYDFDGTTPFSIEVFVVPNITRSGGSTAYALCGKQSQTSPFPGWQLQLRWDGTSATRIELTLINNSASNIAQLRGMTTDLANGTGYHVIVTYDGTKNTNGINFYVDGVFQSKTGGNIANSLTGSIANSAQLSIASRNNALQFVNATMQDVAVYTDAESAGARLYRAGLAAGRSPLAPLTGDEIYIHDSDLNTDVDDVAEFAVWCYLIRKYGTRLRAVTICSENDYSAPCAEALLAHRGITGIPIGAYQGSGVLPSTSPYTQQVASRFGFGSKTKADYSDPVTVMRTVLAAAADNSVVLSGTGSLTNFSALRQSAGDGIDARTGAQLIAAKVKRFIFCGGDYPDSSLPAGGYESNFHKDITATQDVFDNWVGEIVCDGYSVGHNVYCGPPSSADPLTNPWKYAFDLFQTATGQLVNGEREAWGPLHVLYSVLGDIVGLQTGGLRGTNTISGVDGSNVWGMTSGNTSWVFKRASNATLKANLNTILAAIR